MPPKQANKANVVEEKNFDDGTGIKKNIVNFKFYADVTYINELENCNILFEWLEQDGNKKTIDFGSAENFEITNSKPCYDIDDKIPEVQDNSAKEIEVPHKISATAEKTVNSTKIDKKWIKALCENQQKIYIANPEEQTLYGMTEIDYSGILIYKTTHSNVCYTYECDFLDEIKCPLKSFKFRVEIDQELLTTRFKQELNPFCIEVDQIQDQYINQDHLSKFNKIYVSYSFFNKDMIVKTQGINHKKDCVFKHKHVFLQGLEDPHQLKNYLLNERVVFEVHDKDTTILDALVTEKQYIHIEETDPIEELETDPKAKGAKGSKVQISKKEVPKPPPPKKADPKEKDKKKAATKVEVNIKDLTMPVVHKIDKSQLGRSEFYLKDVLNPYNLSFALDAAVCPMMKFFDEERENLKLNDNCRKKRKDMIASSQYMDEASNLNVKFTQCYPIGSFVNTRQEPSSTVASPKKEPIIEQEEDQVMPNEHEMEIEYLRNSQYAASQKPNLPYERVVFLISFKDVDLLKKLQGMIMDINIKLLFPEEGSEIDVRTKTMTLEERESPDFDYIGGVQIIDSQHRLFILEGLAGPGNSIDQLKQITPKLSINTLTYKVIRNESMTYDKRLYLDFECDLKRVKLYKSIKLLCKTNEIYDRKMCPIETYNTIMKIKRTKEKWALIEIEDSGLWITAEELLDFERNYGDALDEFDLYGRETITMKVSKRGQSMSTLTSQSNHQESQNILTVKTEAMTMDYIRQSMKANECSDSQLTDRSKLKEAVSLEAQTLGSENIEPKVVFDTNTKQERNITSPGRITKNTILKSNLKGSKNEQLITVKDSARRAISTEKSYLGRERANTEMTRATSEQHLARFKRLKMVTVPLVCAEIKKKSRKYEEYKMNLIEVTNEPAKKLIDSIKDDRRPGETVYATQSRMLREQARNDKHSVYTWSKDYLGANIDPYTSKEAAFKHKSISESKFITKSGFQHIQKNDHSHRHKLALHESKLIDLKNEPYYIDQERATDFAKFKQEHDGIKGCPMFKTILPPLKHENVNHNLQEKMTASQKIALEKQFKEDEKEKFRSRVIVDDIDFHVNTKVVANKNKCHVDKYKGQLDDRDPVVKKGLILSNKYLKRTTLPTESTFKTQPITYNTNEKKIPGANIQYKRQGPKKFDMDRAVSEKNFWHYTNYAEAGNYVNMIKRKDIFKHNYQTEQ